MGKITIIEGNSNDKDQVRTYLVKGEKGEKGDTGEIADNRLTIGTVTSGETASAEITGTSPNQTLNLVLPKGDKGDKGDTGAKGDTGPAGFEVPVGSVVGFDGDVEDIPDGYEITSDSGNPIGTILGFAGATAPSGYLICDGSAVSRTTYAELFTAIGTAYGTGDGSTTFNIPNLKGKIPVGYDSSDTDFDTLGETGGEKEHTLTTEEMPSHSHQVKRKNVAQLGNGATVITNFGETSYHSIINTAETGSGQSHNNLQPYVVINYIIRAN